MVLVLALAAVGLAQLPRPVPEPAPGWLPEWSRKYAIVVGNLIDCLGGGVEWKHVVGGSQIRVRGRDEILMEGRDRSGLPWRLRASYAGDGGCRFVAYDLDRNGFTDLVVLTANSGSGPAGVTMTVVAFDGLGRPVPWQATGPFALEGDRILNLVDLDGDGKAELLFPYVAEYDLHSRSRELGVSMRLYKIVDGYFVQLAGRFAGRRFPIQQPTGARFEEEPDLTNFIGTPLAQQTLLRVQPRQPSPCWLEGITIKEGGIMLSPDSTARKECKGYLALESGRKIASPLIIVADIPQEGRQIDILHPSREDLLRQVVSRKLAVAFAGRTCEIGCGPLVMWARTK